METIKSAFLSMKADLKSFSKIQCFLTVFLIMISFTTAIVDINYFFGKTDNILIWINNEAAGKSLFKNIVISINGLGTALAIIGLMLSLNGKISNFIWNITSALIYCVFCLGFGYIGGFLTEFFLLIPMRTLSIFLWNKHMDKQHTAIVKYLKWKEWLYVVILLAILFTMFFFAIAFLSEIITGSYYFENNLVARCMEALASAIGVTIHILAINRYLEQWILRILNSMNQIILFSGTLGLDINLNAIMMWTIIIIFSISGLISWIKRMKLQQKDFYGDIELTHIK